jgi:TPR repeat protein
MADKNDIQIQPNQGNSSMIVAGARSNLVARGRSEAAGLMARNSALSVSTETTSLLERGRLTPPPVLSHLPMALLKAAENGDAVAQNDVGVVYEMAKTWPRGPEYWVRIMTKSGLRDDKGEHLADIIRAAFLTSRDYAQAALWYRKAAEQGLAHAQWNLGLLYSSGLGVTQDPDQAAIWLRRAAEQGLASAQYDLGILYNSGGKGLAKNVGEAYFWLEIVASRRPGSNRFSVARDAVAAQLNPTDLAELKTRVNQRLAASPTWK